MTFESQLQETWNSVNLLQHPVDVIMEEEFKSSYKEVTDKLAKVKNILLLKISEVQSLLLMSSESNIYDKISQFSPSHPEKHKVCFFSFPFSLTHNLFSFMIFNF